jgi:hypothetical protein
MNIFEFADIIGKDLVVRRISNQNNRWICDFKYCEIKEGTMLKSSYGDAFNPVDAINDFAKQICGQQLVFNAYMSNRQDFNVPKDLRGYQI